MVPVVSLLQRFHCTGQLTVVPVVSLLRLQVCCRADSLIASVHAVELTPCMIVSVRALYSYNQVVCRAFIWPTFFL